MRHSECEQAEHAADVLRGHLVYIDAWARNCGWLMYDIPSEEWFHSNQRRVLGLIHKVTLAWYNGIRRTGDPNLILKAERFHRLTAAREIYPLLKCYLRATPSNFVPAVSKLG